MILLVEDWANAEKERLDEFVHWWRRGQDQGDEMFPASMDLGEWDEQYRSWCGG